MSKQAPATSTTISYPDISGLTKPQQKKFLKEWLSIQKTRAITDNLDKVMDAALVAALFLGQYAIYQHDVEDKTMPAGGAAVLTALAYMLKDNDSQWATGIVLTPVIGKLTWELFGGSFWSPP